MKTGILIASAALLLAASSCSIKEVKNMVTSIGGRTPSGKVIEKTWQFDNIKSIEASTGVVVHYTQQDSVAPVRISAPEDVLATAIVKMSKNGALEIYLEGGTNFRYTTDAQRLHAYVAAPSVSDFEAHSASSIIVADTLNITTGVEAETHSGAVISFSTLIAPQVEFSTSSGSSIDVTSLSAEKVEFNTSSGSSIDAEAVTAEKFEADASSGSGIHAAGTATEADLEVSSGASIDCSQLKAQRGEATATSGGGIRCNITAAEINRSSGGRVKNLNDK